MTKPTCCELGSPLHEFKAIHNKGFPPWSTFFLLTDARTLLGTVLVLSYLIGQGAGETSFLEPNTVSKMKTHLQVLLRRNKRKKMEKIKKTARKREAGVKK